jgi:peptide/nickel transport system permease protein
MSLSETRLPASEPEPAVSTDAGGARPSFGRYLVRHNRLGLIALGVIVLLVAVAVFAPMIAPYNPQTPTALSFAPPSLAHPFGTDQFGRDILSRVIYGARISLLVGLASVALGGLLGSLLGLIAAVASTLFDQAIMRFMDVLLAFPFILLSILILAFFGQGVANVILAISIGQIPVFARLANATALSLREREFVEAARALGAKRGRIVLVHLAPNMLQPLAVLATFSIPLAILIEAGLDYLGVGVNPSTPTWGQIINQGQQSMTIAPWQVIAPGIAIMLTVMAFNLFGDAIADFLDPKSNNAVWL